MNEVENLYFHHYRPRPPQPPAEVISTETATPSTEDAQASTPSLLPPARLVPPVIRKPSKSPSAASDKRPPLRRQSHSPYSPSPSTALALTASPNYANIHTRPLPTAGVSPKPYSQTTTTAATYINAGNARMNSLPSSSLTSNPYSMTNLSRGTSQASAVSPAPAAQFTATAQKGGSAQTYDSFWTLVGGGGAPKIPAVTEAVAPVALKLGPEPLAKRSGVRKKVAKKGAVGGED